MRRAARRDAIEHHLVSTARKLGATWIYAPPLDGWLWHRRTGWIPVEVKSGKAKKFTEAEEKFLCECIETGAPAITWHALDDVLQMLGAK